VLQSALGRRLWSKGCLRQAKLGERDWSSITARVDLDKKQLEERNGVALQQNSHSLRVFL
jgi:hypothetical protein